jgi:hypothetical protein
MEEYVYEEEHHARWWPFALFSLLIIVGVLVFVFTGDENLRSPGVPGTGCVVMQDRGNYEDSINIIFLGTEYEDIEEFRLDSERFMENFLSVVPHSEYKDRFNFFRIEDFENYGCKYEDAVICNPQTVQRAATKCPGQDMNIVLVSRNKVDNFFKHLRSSAWLNLVSLNSADDPLVLSHEAAHVLYDFADEYVYGGAITWDAPNCDSEKETCPKFSVVEGSECLVGCVNEGNSRPAEYDIMSNYWKSDRYELYNEWWIGEYLEEHTAESKSNFETDGDPVESPRDVYIVEGDCSADGGCDITDVVYSPAAYPTKSNTPSSGSPTVVLKHGKSVVNIPTDNILFKDFGPEGNIEKRPYSFSVAIPVDEKEKDIILYEENVLKEIYVIENVNPSGDPGMGARVLSIPKVS